MWFTDGNIDEFEELEKEGVFSPSTIPKPVPRDGGGCFIATWKAATYLEAVSKNMAEQNDYRYVDKILSIIKEATEYRVKTQTECSDRKLWMSFIATISNLPTEKINGDIIRLIPYWMNPKYDNCDQASSLIDKLFKKFIRSRREEDHRKAEMIIDYMIQLEKVKTTEGETYDTIVPSGLLYDKFSDDGLAVKFGLVCSDLFVYNIASKIRETIDEKNRREYAKKLWEYAYFYRHEPALTFLIYLLMEILYVKEVTGKEITNEVYKFIFEK